MSTILTTEIVDNSIAEIQKYSNGASALLTELENLIISLRASGFIGQASDGYNTFFTAKIKPAIKENLYDGKTSLMGTLEQLMTDIKTQLIDTVDPALRDANEGLNQGSNQG